MANIIVIDDGEAQDAVLLPSLVRGIRYVHTVAALTSECAAAESTDQADCILMLSGAARVSENFLREIVAAVGANGNAAAMGAHAARPGMRFTAGGLILKDGTLEDCATTGHPETRADLAVVYPAHAVSYQAAAFRRSAWRAVGGLDRAFEDDLGAAVIDLCFRLRQEGWSVLADPLATIELQPSFGEQTWISLGWGGNSHSTELLRTRWFDVLVSHPPLYCGHATVIGIPAEFKDDLSAVRRLREWGYSVDYLSAVALPQEEANDLRRAGVVLTLANDIGTALASGGATLVYAAAVTPTLDFIPPGCQLLVGLTALERSRQATSGAGITSGDESSVNELRVRQVAGL